VDATPTEKADSLRKKGERLEGLGELRGAADAYSEALALHPDPAITRLLAVVESASACRGKSVKISGLQGYKLVLRHLRGYGFEAEVEISPPDQFSGKEFMDADQSEEGQGVPVSEKDGEPETQEELSAIWVGCDVPAAAVVAAITIARKYWPRMRYLASSCGDQWVNTDAHEQVFLGGATSSAIDFGLGQWSETDFARLRSDMPQEELHRLIMSREPRTNKARYKQDEPEKP